MPVRKRAFAQHLLGQGALPTSIISFSISLLLRPGNRIFPVYSSYTTQPMLHMSIGVSAHHMTSTVSDLQPEVSQSIMEVAHK